MAYTSVPGPFASSSGFSPRYVGETAASRAADVSRSSGGSSSAPSTSTVTTPITSTPTLSPDKQAQLDNINKLEQLGTITSEQAAQSRRVLGLESSIGPTTPETQLINSIADIFESIIQSGQQISPTITSEEIDALAQSLNLEDFLAQAEVEIAPEYAQKFRLATEDLQRSISQTSEQLGLTEAEVGRQAEKTALTGAEQFAQRGLAFSGSRQQFERELTEEKQRQLEDYRRQALQTTGEAGRLTERQLGTEALQNFQVPQLGDRPAFELSAEPIIGELQREREAMKGEMGRELRLQEAQRRAFTRMRIPT